MAKELQYLGDALERPVRPFVAILGGAKVSDKIEVIENLLGKVDTLLIGGAMAYTFFKAQSLPVGTSLVEAERLGSARDIVAHGRAAQGPAGAAAGSRGRRRGSRPACRPRSWRSRIPPLATGWASTSARKRRRLTQTC